MQYLWDNSFIYTLYYQYTCISPKRVQKMFNETVFMKLKLDDKIRRNHT